MLEVNPNTALFSTASGRADCVRLIATLITSFLLFGCMSDFSHAQSVKTKVPSPVVQTPSTTAQVSRQPLRSRFGNTDNEEVITLGNQNPGERLGLEGIVYRYDDVKSEKQNGGYMRWYVLLRRMDGKPFGFA